MLLREIHGVVCQHRQEIGHYGRKVVQFRRACCAAVLSLGFEVTDVTRPLVAVRRIIEKGDKVLFDQGRWRIVSKARGSEIHLERRNVCHFLNVGLLANIEDFTRQM